MSIENRNNPTDLQNTKPQSDQAPAHQHTDQTASVGNAIARLGRDGLNGKDLSLAMAKVAFQEALQGNWKFWNSIVERLDGNSTEQTELTIRIEYMDTINDGDKNNQAE